MNDYAVATAPGTIRLQRTLPGPAERVWSYLTDSTLRGQWLATGAMELRVGGRVEHFFLHADLSPQPEPTPERYKGIEKGHRSAGTITRIDPPRLLSYTWEESKGYSEVTFELAEQGPDIVLTITHSLLPDRKEMISVAGGWHTHVEILIDRLNDRTPAGFWSTHEKIAAAYADRFDQAEGARA